MLTGISVPDLQTRALYIRQQRSISMKPSLCPVVFRVDRRQCRRNLRTRQRLVSRSRNANIDQPVVALLRAGDGWHGNDHRRFRHTALNSSRTMGSLRRRDDNSRRKVQNVRKDSSDEHHGAVTVLSPDCRDVGFLEGHVFSRMNCTPAPCIPP